jgi:hypothetical protein
VTAKVGVSDKTSLVLPYDADELKLTEPNCIWTPQPLPVPSAAEQTLKGSVVGGPDWLVRADQAFRPGVRRDCFFPQAIDLAR